MTWIRIIGGQLRGRKIKVLKQPGLRPSGDRARETLFNWLTPNIVQANCLDLFAGSGALGFEALSRGARHSTLLDSCKKVCKHLQHTQHHLGLQSCKVSCCNSSQWLKTADPSLRYDIVFIDPPFHQPQFITNSLQLLVDHQRLLPDAQIYIESPKDHHLILDTQLWQVNKEKIMGQVKLQLLQKT